MPMKYVKATECSEAPLMAHGRVIEQCSVRSTHQMADKVLELRKTVLLLKKAMYNGNLSLNFSAVLFHGNTRDMV